MTRFKRRGISRKWLWAAAFKDAWVSGEGAKKNRVFEHLARPATCGGRLSDFADLRLNVSGCASYAGVIKCSSAWACPTCAATIRQRRSLDIQQAVDQHQKKGGSILFLTLTLRHSKTMPLAFTLDALLDGWRRLIRGNPWQRWKETLSLVGFIKAVEITLSDSDGWHPHLHVLLFCDTKVEKSCLENFRSWVFKRWADKLMAVAEEWKAQSEKKTGWNIRPSEAHGVDLQLVDGDGKVVALYISKIQDDHAQDAHKWNVAGEMARADIKEGRQGDGDVHINPFQLLDEGCPLEWDERRRRAKWSEFVRFTKGRSCIQWSQGLAARFDLEELSDEEVVAEETKHAVAAWRCRAKEYDAALKRNPSVLAEAKHRMEALDLDGVAELLPGQLVMTFDEDEMWAMALEGKKEISAKTLPHRDAWSFEPFTEQMKAKAAVGRLRAKPFQDKWKVSPPVATPLVQ